MGTSNFLYRDSLYAIDTQDEFLYDDTKASIISALDEYKDNPSYTAYGYDDGPTDDNHNFPGCIIGHVYKEFEFTSEHASDSITFTIGDDFCLRSGYYSGFNFDRVESRYAENGCDELEVLSDDLHERLYKYDELGLSTAVDNGAITAEESEEIKGEIYNKAVAEMETFIAEANRIYHELGGRLFDSYRVVARANNGETVYEKTA